MINSPLSRLLSVNAFVQEVVTNAQAHTGDEEVWHMTYNLVFSDNCSSLAYDLMKELNISFDYYDPDTTYQEDVEAFAQALNSTCRAAAQLAPQLRAKFGL